MGEKYRSGVSESFCTNISSLRTDPVRFCLWTHSRGAEAVKTHGSDCSQKHAYRAPDRQRSDIRGQSVTLVMSPDRAGSSCCFDSADDGPPGTETKLGVFLRTCQLNCHLEKRRRRKTSKCLKTLMTSGLIFKSYYYC